MIRRTLASLLVLGLLTTGAPASTATPTPATAPMTVREQAVTLITGDRVFASRRDGKWHARVEPVRRLTPRPGGFLHHGGPDNLTVIPTDAVPLIRKGLLDKAFFDVTGLIRQGYDDAHSKVTPVLVAGAGRRSAATELGRVTRELPAAGLTAVAAAKDSATFDALTRESGRRLTAGVSKVWLNRKAFPSLDVSVPQVGAPAAWQAGQTGRGATVAVLDTGYDAGHPDLAGVVTGERDFTGDGIRDTVGHGTHVAATVAGRNAPYTGVAKAANLMIGKVCVDQGCPYDAIIAGMQWAAASGARVVNLSLGGSGTDGTDPLSTELNRLTAEHGTLFVVAAGNSGNNPRERVSTPAAADAALAVASVSKQDQASGFSSPGPRIGDYALKPDIAAPGERIVAARAAGTLDDVAVGEHHARLSGTSMATPHVAGAAAILAAQHPDWRADQLKAALMNTAHPVSASVYKQGAGRLDVGRAVRQQVTTAPASLGFRFQWPHDASPPVTRQVSYRNAGDTPIQLRIEANEAPNGMIRVEPSTVTVPAGGESAVTVTVDPRLGPVGNLSGWLIATGGDTVVRTAIGMAKEPESHDFTVRMTDRDGAPAAPDWAVAGIFDLDDPANWHHVANNETVRVTTGRYAVMGFVVTPVQGERGSTTSAAEPEITVTGRTSVHLDARKGKPVSIRTEAKDARLTAAIHALFLINERLEVSAISGATSDVYTVPTQGSHSHFYYYDRFQLERPVVRLLVTAPEGFEVPVEWAPDAPQTTDVRALTAVDAGHARPEDIATRDLRGKLAVFTLGAGEEEEYDQRVKALGDAGAAAALFYFSEPVDITVSEVAPIPVLSAYTSEGVRLARLGTASVTVAANYASPYRYELAYPSFGRIPSALTYRPRNRELAAVRARYHAHVDGGVAYTNHQVSSGKLEMDWNLWSGEVRAPVERTEFYSPDVRWQHGVALSDHRSRPTHEQSYDANELSYRAGERLSRSWNKAAIGPGLAFSYQGYTEKPHLAFRDGDTIDALLPLFSDAESHGGLSDGRDGDTAKGDTSLYAGDELIGRSGIDGEGSFTVPAGEDGYRLVAEVTRDHPAWPLSTKVNAEWTFRSGHTDAPTALPLLAVGFQPRVDLRNYAARGRLTIPVTVARQPGSTGGATNLRTVEVSYDDGTTWRRAPIRKTRQGWSITVTNPAGGFVSLRASASDTAGNTVTQTITRAYRVR